MGSALSSILALGVLAKQPVYIMTMSRISANAFKSALLIASACLASQAVSQEVLFQEDFSGPIDGSPNPVWSWDVAPDDIREGMMIGEGDIYQMAEGQEFLSHRKALKLDFSGRNGFCNTCGGDYAEVTRVSEGEACVDVDSVSHESYVYNLTNHFSTWPVKTQSEDGSLVCFDTESPIEHSIGGVSSSVSVGDSVFVPYVCGLNGVVGRDIDRRSDCNKAINYLSQISSDAVGYGETLSRRFYFYVDNEAQLPDITFKLGYAAWMGPDGKVRQSELNISVQRDMTFVLLTPSYQRVTRSGDEHIQFERDTWYYVEEVFKRESSPSSSDAEYTLYAGAAGSEHTVSPTYHEEGFLLGELRRMSIGGNWQHNNDVSGHVYFDNILIKRGRAGPVNRPDINP